MKEQLNENTLKADGFDEAIIGVDFVSHPARIIYNKQKMLDILIERDGMTDEEAIEYLEYNVLGAYVGEGTPIYMDEGTSTEVFEMLSDYGF